MFTLGLTSLPYRPIDVEPAVLKVETAILAVETGILTTERSRDDSLCYLIV